jgi:hypothetical protein
VRGTLNLIQVKVLAVRDELASPHGFLQAEEGTLPHRGQALCCASQQKLTADDRYGSMSVFGRCPRHFRFALDSGPMTDIGRGQFRAKCRHLSLN